MNLTLRFPHESSRSINTLRTALRNSASMMWSFLTGYEARGDHTMRATEVLQKCLGDALKSMHAQRVRTLLHAVEALTQGRRLTLMDLARSWPGAERSRAPFKTLDRLLSKASVSKCCCCSARWPRLPVGSSAWPARPVASMHDLHRSGRNDGSIPSCDWGAKHWCDDGHVHA